MNSVFILGNPNSGKSLLFNKLTGLQQKVANFPGITVDIRSGRGATPCESLLFKDFPGIYSLHALTKDESVAIESFRNALKDAELKTLLYVIDATRLERSLYLLLQLINEVRPHQKNIVVAVNILDEVVNKGCNIDIESLSKALGLTFVGVSAKTELGLAELKQELLSNNVGDSVSVPNMLNFGSSLTELKSFSAKLAKDFGPKSNIILKSQERLDKFFLGTFFGPLIFAFLMLIMFQSIFTWSSPFMDFISTHIDGLGSFFATRLPAGIVSDFVKDALFAGLGSFLVFAPQIFVLFFLIGILDDSGYLGRAAIICHRPLHLFGLSGRSFVPLLSGSACAIPAIMSTRTIESPKRRFLTILAVPFMVCSARLPVYALLIGAFIPAKNILFGLVGLQGFVFFLMYVGGIFSGLIVAAVTSKLMSEKTQDAPFIVELPPYRWPSLSPILHTAFSRTLNFIKTAGGIIFAVTVLIWCLGYFPGGPGHLQDSYLASIGKTMEPIFLSIGLDWRIGVAVITSFLAREVFVATLGTMIGIENAAEHMGTLSLQIKHIGLTLPAVLGLLVFYALAMQCVSTLAVVKRETGSWKVPVWMFISYSALAYVGAWIVYHTANLFL